MLACLPGGARSPGHPSHYTRHPGRHRDPRAETSGQRARTSRRHRAPTTESETRGTTPQEADQLSLLSTYSVLLSSQYSESQSQTRSRGPCQLWNCQPRSPSLKPIRVRFTRCRRACPGPCQGRVGRWGTTQQVQVRRAQGRIWASCSSRVHGKGPGHGCSGPTSIHVRGQAEYMYPRPGAR